MNEIARDSRGNCLFVAPNEVGGRTYWSDEIGSGVMVWDTSLVSEEMVRLALEAEAQAQAREGGKVDWP